MCFVGTLWVLEAVAIMTCEHVGVVVLWTVSEKPVSEVRAFCYQSVTRVTLVTKCYTDEVWRVLKKEKTIDV
jgi:hypothetical protein